MSRALVWKPRALKDVRKLDRQAQQRVLAALDAFAETGRGDVVKLQDIQPPEYRLRIGEYRVRLRLGGQLIEVLHVLPRSQAYR